MRYVLSCSTRPRAIYGWHDSRIGGFAHPVRALTIPPNLVASHMPGCCLLDVTAETSGFGFRVRLSYSAPREAGPESHVRLAVKAQGLLAAVGEQLVSAVVSDFSGAWAAQALTPMLGAGPAGVVGELVGVVAAREVQRYLLTPSPYGWTCQMVQV